MKKILSVVACQHKKTHLSKHTLPAKKFFSLVSFVPKTSTLAICSKNPNQGK